MIIDSHCHAGTGDGFTGPWDTRADLGRYHEWCREAGISHSVLFAPFHSDNRVANAEVARLVMANPRRFSGYVFVNSVRDAGRVLPMVSHHVRRHGFRGIKCHRYDGRISREVCEAARRLRIPVLYDVMGDVASIDLFAPEYPEVAFIIPHLGSFADDWKAQRAFLDPLSRLPNVFTDTSGVRRFDLLEEALQRAGAGKILYGSDGPWLHPGVELSKILALRMSAGDRQLVLAGNWLRLTRQHDSFRRSILAFSGGANLQGPVRHTEASGCALQASSFRPNR